MVRSDIIRLGGKWVPIVDFKYQKSTLEAFVRNYGHYYLDEFPEGLDANDLFRNLGSFQAKMVYFQIYSYLHFMDKEDNIYYGYYKLLNELFGIDCNILDVASGYIPSFASIVRGEQLRIGKGTVTVCDLKLIRELCDKGNMVVKKDTFENVDFKKYDLITSIMPCTITEDVIKRACDAKKPFFIGLCLCYPDIDQRVELIRKICESYGRKLNETDIGKQYGKKLQVVYSI